MKILQINKYLYAKGGAEIHLLALKKLLENNGQGVVCFSQKNPLNIPCEQESLFIEDLDLSGFSLKSLYRLPRLFWSFKASRLIQKVVLETKPDIAHIHNIYHQLSPSILPTLKRLGVPVVMTVHDFKLIRHDYTLRADGRAFLHKDSLLTDLILHLEFWLHRYLKVYQNNVDLFIAPSEFVKNQLVKHGFDPNKIVVQPHFVPDEFLLAALAPVATSSEKYIFSYGRLDESKGFSGLITAFANIGVNGLKLKIAGAGPNETQLQQQINDFGLADKIELVGQKNRGEIIELIKNSLFVVNCSRVHETFGLTVLEAMSLGKAVIASKVGAIPELIENEKTGLLYEVSDLGALKEQLTRLLSDETLRNYLGDQAQQESQKYDGQAYYHKILAIYQTAITRHKKPLRRINMLLVNLILLVTLSALLTIPFYQINIEQGQAYLIPNHDYPRLVNLYWRNPITPEVAKELAKWDVLVLDMTAQTYSADAIRDIRKLNPKIVILAYTSANEMPTSRLNSIEPAGYGMWHQLAKGDQNIWHLKTANGEDISFWAGNVMMNLGTKDNNGQTYADYLVNFYTNQLLSSGLWDGLLFDNTWQNVSSLNNNIDINNDGRADSAAVVNSAWQKSYNTFFEKLRASIGSRYLIIGNGDGDYSQYTNGRELEGFPEYWEGGFNGQMPKLEISTNSGYQPRFNIINSDSNNTGNQNDYQTMRFGLASALMFNAYYSFDYGPNLREQLWWYDEYNVSLGQPTGNPINLTTNNKAWSAAVWQRNFENGVVLLNSSQQAQKLSFDAELEKIRGTQDKTTNDGSIVNQLTLPAGDAIILLKPLNELTDAVYTNGSFARIFSGSGQVKRTGFFVYNSNFTGGNKVIKTDLNGDGENEILTAGLSSISLFDKNGNNLKTVYPYGLNFRGGFNLALTKLPSDSELSIVVAPEKGGSNLIKYFDHNLIDTNKSFTAYSPLWKNLGASVAACDLNNDGEFEIITGAGSGGGPHIKVFTSTGKLLKEWFAYNSNFRGGVNVACGDLSGDNTNQVVTGAGVTGGPHVKVFNASGQLIKEWFAFDTNSRQGVNVSVADVDGDGKVEVVALSSGVFTANAK